MIQVFIQIQEMSEADAGSVHYGTKGVATATEGEHHAFQIIEYAMRKAFEEIGRQSAAGMVAIEVSGRNLTPEEMRSIEETFRRKQAG